MRIGHERCYLQIAHGPAEFIGVNAAIYFSNGEAERRAFSEFAELRSRSVTIALTEDGSIELRRGVRGNIDVFVAVAFSRSGTQWTTSGVVPVHGEDTQQFPRAFRALVFEPS
jgi:hypothetical protein